MQEFWRQSMLPYQPDTSLSEADAALTRTAQQFFTEIFVPYVSERLPLDPDEIAAIVRSCGYEFHSGHLYRAALDVTSRVMTNALFFQFTHQDPHAIGKSYERVNALGETLPAEAQKVLQAERVLFRFLPPIPTDII